MLGDITRENRFTRDTSGIAMWSKPFQLKIGNNETLAVILMDTEGFFDADSTMEDYTRIFALSSLLCSVQIYNLVERLQLDFMKQVEIFKQYGFYATLSGKAKPFQNLVYLIRDWPNKAEYNYGVVGGRTYLRRCTESGSKEIQKICNNVENCFETVSCFLMPHPGLEVAEAEEPFRCLEIKNDFLDEVRSFTKWILSKDHLIVKKIGGAEVTCRELLRLFIALTELFNNNSAPPPKVLFERMEEVMFESALDECRNFYRRKVSEFCNLHFEGRETVDLEHLYLMHLKKNDERATIAEFEEFNKRLKSDAIEIFKKNVRGVKSGVFEIFVKTLENYAEDELDKMKLNVKENAMKLERALKIVGECETYYGEEIKNDLLKHGLQSTAVNLEQLYCMYSKMEEAGNNFEVLKRQHNKEKRAALKKFEERIQSVSDGLRTDWVKKLEEQIEVFFSSFLKFLSITWSSVIP
ncbi:unnamed protein product [Enterobius vermicularis]|uniref:GB1/RHD3-type G domain-containing protein n=1 Tax=Enterobius vermicularis TaxID=51028 RepID=A0A0N4VET1_ENTVE|nr:unnamed protein product [Enterobius vermicularis]